MQSKLISGLFLCTYLVKHMVNVWSLLLVNINKEVCRYIHKKNTQKQGFHRFLSLSDSQLNNSSG